MRIYLYEDLRRDPRGLIRDVLGFLGVDPGFEPDVSARPNVSGLPRWPAFDRLLRRLLNRPVLVKRVLRPLMPARLRRDVMERLSALRSRNLVRPELSGRARARLVEIYRDDVERLSRRLGRDLSHWQRVAR